MEIIYILLCLTETFITPITKKSHHVKDTVSFDKR